MNTKDVYIKKLTPDATIPEYKSEGSAGFDLASASKHKVTIHPNETKLISTGLAMGVPMGYEVQIRPRSGMSLNTKLRISNSPGTIDSEVKQY